jgi:opacity protein-like surface antigen
MKTLAIFVSLGVGALGLSALARADSGLPPAPAALDPEDALNPISIVSGAGVKVGEGTVLNPQVGVETGVVSNVFFQDTQPITAGLLRILVEVGTGSLPNQRLTIHAGGDDQDPGTPQTLTTTNPGDFQYSANLYASWDQYLSTNRDVNAQGGLGGGVLLRGLFNPQRPLQFAFQEHFSRMIRATNFESRDVLNRDLNSLSLRLNYLPSGRSLGGYAYYQNTIDVFEGSSLEFANRLQNLVGVRVNWQWLPLTRVFVDVSEGLFTGLGNSQKATSFPFTAIAGIQTALTLNTTVNAHVGYTNGFYASGPNYAGVAGAVLFGYRYSPLGRITALYGYDHEDSINANFYRDHMFQASIEQYFVPFVVFARPELRLRQYEGTLVMGTDGSHTRDDLIVGATVGMRYSFRDWLAGTLDYDLSVIQTNFRYNVVGSMGLVDDPSYVRHELLLGVRAAY